MARVPAPRTIAALSNLSEDVDVIFLMPSDSLVVEALSSTLSLVSLAVSTSLSSVTALMGKNGPFLAAIVKF